MTPKVTLVSSCYNHSRYIIEHLESVRNQDYPNIEHIIIDDASTDDSLRLIEQWIAETGHECTLIRHEKNKGICASLNEGIGLSSGELWGYLGTDDILPSYRTTVMANFLRDHPEELMVAGDATFIDEDGKPCLVDGESNVYKWMAKSNPLYRHVHEHEDLGTFRGNFISCHVPTWMFRKSTFDLVGLFDERMKVEDWEMWLRISDRRRIPFIMEPLMFYRRHDSNISKNEEVMANERVKLRLLNYKRARRHVEKSLLRSIMIGEFHEFVSNPKNLGNLIMFLKSPARWIVILGVIDYLRNAVGFRLLR